MGDNSRNTSKLKLNQNKQAKTMNVAENFTGKEPESKLDGDLDIDLIKVSEFFCQELCYFMVEGPKIFNIRWL